MKDKKATPDRLWPILIPDARIPLPPAAWVVLNIVAALTISIPFVVIVAFLSGGLWLANEMRDLLEVHFAAGAELPLIATNVLKLLLLAITGRIADILVSCIPHLVHEAREGLKNFDPF
ncbi:conserved hypothetical protein [Paraburkholderia sabiae]|uniref:hypothetical protein n=1 Tax=Paraburkholderia sabiae TaxID=273251 RepID=UPI001CB52A79|nr:hypothetical protein [Paraburkholderia sabiae]CAG9233362.1 conserved hypothetical protein [Paraburkholderia sabiae]